MFVLRWLGAGLLWILAGVVGLIGVLLSITIILLPIGIPVLLLAKKIGGLATALMLPKAVRHPVQELGDKMPDTSLPDAGKLREKAPRKLGRRSRADRLKPWK